MSHAPSDLTLSADERHALRAVVQKIGERSVLADLKISRQALSRALAGLPVRRGTLALVRAGLAPEDLRAKLEEHTKKDENAIQIATHTVPGDHALKASRRGGRVKSRRAS